MKQTTIANYMFYELGRIADRIVKELEKELNDYYIGLTVTDKIYIDIGVPFSEIPDDVSIEELDKKYCVYNEAKVKTDKYTVEIYPLDCGENNYLCGLKAEIRIRRNINDIDIGNIASLIVTVFRL
jgi:hypothetical protein